MDADKEFLLKGKAYALFYEDLAQHLSFLEAFTETKKAKNNESIKDLEVRFHRLKGSSGMFGFEEIAKSAKLIEDAAIKFLSSTNSHTSGCAPIHDASSYAALSLNPLIAAIIPQQNILTNLFNLLPKPVSKTAP